MKIAFIYIRNFRKLKDVKIDFSDETTLFVGANNSGKTSAMDALCKFLIKNDSFVYNDLTVTNRGLINSIGDKWISSEAEKPNNLDDWADKSPMIDIWLDVRNDELQYVANIIPTLEWDGGKLGVRLSYLPKDIEKLFGDYKNAYEKARKTETDKSNMGSVKLQPQNLCGFIENTINKYFDIKAFILDPEKINEEQKTDFDCECAEKNPFTGLIKIDMIAAQRGLTDADATNNIASLSQQFRSYYDKHLDIDKATAPEDLETLSALQEAHNIFDKTLGIKFKDALAELETLGYPGITDPKITIESKLKEKNAFEHDSAVQYALADTDSATDFRLPEKYNGLGYQNLISIAFRLMSFRDDRIHKNKASADENADNIVPLHLVLIEEPEAHLHVQVQQVMIKKAYHILTNSSVLKDNNFNTQLVVSTHSSHIAREVEFRNIRYFKRIEADSQCIISTSNVINLTNTFGEDEKTEKFVQRYLDVTHCDLFFADAVILVEGTSEAVLVPYFIKHNFKELDSQFISILPIGGSHSHRFKPLIERIGIYTLIITDIDPIDKNAKRKSVAPKRDENIISGNVAIREWGISQKDSSQNPLNYLLDLSNNKKEISLSDDTQIKIAYQTAVPFSIGKEKHEFLSATFEGALIYSNLTGINKIDSKTFGTDNIIEDIKKASEKMEDISEAIYKIVRENNKVTFALNLIYEIENVAIPPYIEEGLSWLQGKLKRIQ
ncbi:hypothetical protein R84B8_00840 [Treponema sp. R8-4-B8]